MTRREDQSGESDPELGISKAGNEYVRQLLVGSAHYILGPFGPDCDLRRWGLAKARGSKSAKKRAVVAVARKLAVLMYRLWLTGEFYEPLRKAATNGSLPAQDGVPLRGVKRAMQPDAALLTSRLKKEGRRTRNTRLSEVKPRPRVTALSFLKHRLRRSDCSTHAKKDSNLHRADSKGFNKSAYGREARPFRTQLKG